MLITFSNPGAGQLVTCDITLLQTVPRHKPEATWWKLTGRRRRQGDLSDYLKQKNRRNKERNGTIRASAIRGDAYTHTQLCWGLLSIQCDFNVENTSDESYTSSQVWSKFTWHSQLHKTLLGESRGIRVEGRGEQKSQSCVIFHGSPSI